MVNPESAQSNDPPPISREEAELSVDAVSAELSVTPRQPIGLAALLRSMNREKAVASEPPVVGEVAQSNPGDLVDGATTIQNFTEKGMGANGEAMSEALPDPPSEKRESEIVPGLQDAQESCEVIDADKVDSTLHFEEVPVEPESFLILPEDPVAEKTVTGQVRTPVVVIPPQEVQVKSFEAESSLIPASPVEVSGSLHPEPHSIEEPLGEASPLTVQGLTEVDPKQVIGPELPTISELEAGLVPCSEKMTEPDLESKSDDEVLPTPSQKLGHDWVDAHAVSLDVAVPVEGVMAEILERPTEDLLEEALSGAPVANLLPTALATSPGYVPAPELGFGFPLGPLIWEPDQEVVTWSGAEGDTVWFGLHDPMPAPVAPLPLPLPIPPIPVPVPALRNTPLEELPLEPAVPNNLIKDLPAEAPVSPTAATRETEIEQVSESLPGKAALFQTIAQAPPVATHESSELGNPDKPEPPLIQAEVELRAPIITALPGTSVVAPIQHLAQPEIVEVRPVKKSILPKPRAEGVSPRTMTPEVEVSTPSSDPVFQEAGAPEWSRLLPFGQMPHMPAVLEARRGMEPLAPSSSSIPPPPRSSRRWPLVLTALVMLSIVAMALVGRWWETDWWKQTMPQVFQVPSDAYSITPREAMTPTLSKPLRELTSTPTLAE